MALKLSELAKERVQAVLRHARCRCCRPGCFGLVIMNSSIVI
jgi:hypothetical protein